MVSGLVRRQYVHDRGRNRFPNGRMADIYIFTGVNKYVHGTKYTKTGAHRECTENDNVLNYAL